MSEAVGLMALGDADQEVFMGRDLMQRRTVSEHTAQIVDKEIKRILDEAHNRARVIVEREGELLERLAVALLERETVGRDEIQKLADDEPLPPLPEVEAGTSAGNGDGGAQAGADEATATVGAASEDKGAR